MVDLEALHIKVDYFVAEVNSKVNDKAQKAVHKVLAYIEEMD